jgi:hypothetical protein
MNEKDFIDMVKRMRTHQKAFFKDRKHSDLEDAKKYERAVDKEIADYEDQQLKMDM